MKIFIRLTLMLMLAGLALGGSGSSGSLRGDRVGWARLKTPSEWWKRHAEADPNLMRFFREQTTLNIDPTWYEADANNLRQLCQYPLLFAQDLHPIREPLGRTNVAEFVRRGGFLLVDACSNRKVNPDPDVFLQHQIEFITAILPEARVVALPKDHAVYRCHFQIPGGHPPHTYFTNVYDPAWFKHGLYGIMIGPRLAGVITLSGLQCAWSKVAAPPNHDVACMKMLVNIYIYAMMQGA